MYIVNKTWRISHILHTQCPLLDTPFNITVIQVYALTNNAEEAEVEWFYEDLQDLLELTSKTDVLFITGDWNAKEGSQAITGVTGNVAFGYKMKQGKA